MRSMAGESDICPAATDLRPLPVVTAQAKTSEGISLSVIMLFASQADIRSIVPNLGQALAERRDPEVWKVGLEFI